MPGRRALRVLTLLFATVAMGAPAQAAASPAGLLDTSFGTAGQTILTHGSSVAAAADVVTPDGHTIVAGESRGADGSPRIFVARLTSGGQLDANFGSGGWTTISVNGAASMDSGAALVLQPDGKILVAGVGTDATTGQPDFAVARVNPDGSLDASFGSGGAATVRIANSAEANAVLVQPDGKIVLAGTALGNANEFAAARLNSDGSVDSSYGTGGIATVDVLPSAAWGAVLQPDGKVVLGGEANDHGTEVYMAARLGQTGQLDSSFGQGGVKTIAIGAKAIGDVIALQPDGKIILSGNAYTTTGVAATVRLLPDGSLDPSFGSGGIANVDFWFGVNAIVIAPDGRIVIAATGVSVVRLNPNGSPDSTFGTNGVTTITVGSTADAANGVALDLQGDIVLAGVTNVGGGPALYLFRLAGGSSGTSPATSTQATTTSSTGTTTSSTGTGASAARSQTAAPPVKAPGRISTVLAHPIATGRHTLRNALANAAIVHRTARKARRPSTRRRKHRTKNRARRTHHR